MPAVQVPDAALQAVVQFFKFSVAVLPPLYRLMVGGAGGVGTDFPAVAPQRVMVGVLDFIVQLAELIHDIPPAGIFNTDAAPTLLLNGAQAALRQRRHGAADGRVQVQCTCGNLPESKIHCTGVGCLQWLHLALRRIGPQVTQQFAGLALGHAGVGFGHPL